MAVIKSQPKVTWLLKTAVFIFFLSFYLMTTPNDRVGGDSQFMFWVCQSLVEDGDINILNQSFSLTKEKNDRWGLDNYVLPYSKFPLTPSLIGIPFYVAAKGVSRLLNRHPDNDDLVSAVSFSAPLITALTCLLLFQYILTFGFSPRAALLSTCFYALGTIIWFNAQYLATEPITMFATLAAVYSAYLYKSVEGIQIYKAPYSHATAYNRIGYWVLSYEKDKALVES